MADHLALKRLTASDLTLFESLFRRLNAGNQKAINLNADVFVGALYPSAPTLGTAMDNEIPLALSLFGPGGKPAHKMTRKISDASSRICPRLICPIRAYFLS